MSATTEKYLIIITDTDYYTDETRQSAFVDDHAYDRGDDYWSFESFGPMMNGWALDFAHRFNIGKGFDRNEWNRAVVRHRNYKAHMARVAIDNRRRDLADAVIARLAA